MNARVLRTLVFATACGLAANSLAAALYKWVDEKGVVHYTDKMPPEAVDRGNVELSKQGVAIKKVDPALTAEQRRAKEQEEERKRALAKQQEEVARRDRALLASYTSESEIDLARQRAINAIDSVVQSSAAYTERASKRKAEVQQQMATFTNQKRPVPPVLEREFESLNEELDRQAEVVATKRKEAAAINAKYDADKARWRELAAQRAAEAAAASMTPTTARNK